MLSYFNVKIKRKRPVEGHFGGRRGQSGRAQGGGAGASVRGAVRGRVGRERGGGRAALYRGGPRVLAGWPAVGGFGLRVVLRGLLAAVGKDCGSLGPEEDFRRGDGPVHGGFGVLRVLGLPGYAGCFARRSGGWGVARRGGG